MTLTNDEIQSLEAYRESRYPCPAVTTDVLIFTVRDTDLKVLLIRREDAPYQGQWSIPGGFLKVGDAYEDQGENLDEGAERVLREKTGLRHDRVFLEQLYTFGQTGRDPRMRVVSVVYYALIPPEHAEHVIAGRAVSEVQWASVADLVALGELAFDHTQMIGMGVDRLRGKIDYSNIAFELVPDTFTVAELRAVHEAIKATQYDPSNFRRRFKRMLEDEIIMQAPGKRHTVSRPARVFKFMRERREGGS